MLIHSCHWLHIRQRGRRGGRNEQRDAVHIAEDEERGEIFKVGVDNKHQPAVLSFQRDNHPNPSKAVFTPHFPQFPSKQSKSNRFFTTPKPLQSPYYFISIILPMNSLVDHNAHFDQLANYFASYLRDISTIITQVKSHAYSIINVPQPAHKSMAITSDISSIMAACKRTYDDIKRVESILKGHAKGKGNDSSASGSRVSSTRKLAGASAGKINGIQLQLQAIVGNKESRIQSAQELAQSPERLPQKLKDFPAQIQEESKSTRISNRVHHQPSEQQKGAELIQSYRSEGNPHLQTRIQNMRESRQRELQSFASSNQDCLSLIKRIREELQLKKKK